MKKTDEAEPQMFHMYRENTVVKYAYGEPWVAMAMFMNDYGFDTEEEALADYNRKHKD